MRLIIDGMDIFFRSTLLSNKLCSGDRTALNFFLFVDSAKYFFPVTECLWQLFMNFLLDD